MENKTGSGKHKVVENKTDQTKKLPVVENKNKFYNSLAFSYNKL